MNITIYSYEAFARLLWFCISFGLASSIIYSSVSAMLMMSQILRCSNWHSLKLLVSDRSVCHTNHRIARDFLSLVIIAVAVIMASFIANSGKLRLMSVLIIVMGFECGLLLFNRLVFSGVVFLIYLIKRILEVMVAPAVFLIRRLQKFINRIYIIVKARNQRRRIAKYTEKMYKYIEILKQNGMLESLDEVL